MILTKEHIGKKVRNDIGAISILVGIHENELWLNDGRGCETYRNYGWELVPEEKLPSERIIEISIKIAPKGSQPTSHDYITAILDFLDEEFKARKK